MQIDEQWVGKQAGWKVLKAGRDLLRSGAVKYSRISEAHDLVEGEMRGSSKPLKFKIKIHGMHDVENGCRCFKAKRTGEICEHAVALMLHALDVPLAQEANLAHQKAGGSLSATASQAEDPPIPAAAMRVILPPHFPKQLEKGCTLKLEKIEDSRESEGGETTEGTEAVSELNDADVRWLMWLASFGLRDIPPMLALRPEDISGMVQHLSGHTRIQRGNDQLVRFTHDSIRVPVSLTGDDERVEMSLSLSEETVVYAIQDTLFMWDESLCVLASKQFGKVDGIGAHQLTRLAGGGVMNVPVKQFLREASEWEKHVAWGEAEWLRDTRIIAARPRFEVKCTGSLSSVRVKLEVNYSGHKTESVDGGWSNHPFPIADRNTKGVWMVRNRDAEREALTLLETYHLTNDGKGWRVEGEEQVLDFLSHALSDLESRAEWAVEIANNVRSLRENMVRITPDIKFEGSGEDWLAFDYDFKTPEGKQVPREMINKMLRAGKRSATTKNGKRIVISEFDSEIMTEVLHDVDPSQEGGKYVVDKSQAAYLRQLRSYYTKGGKNIHSIQDSGSGAASRKDQSLLESVPQNVRDLYREYQREGVTWMYRTVMEHGGALLADDMGLGKTLQTLSVIHLMKKLGEKDKTHKHEGKPALVVAPTSLLFNWREEAEKFFPDLKVEILHGSKRDQSMQKDADVFITSYGVVVRDEDFYKEKEFGVVVIDEASVIRNPDTQSAKALRKVNADCRIALTGTPIENALQDLWSIFTFILPGYLGRRDDFKTRYVKPLQLGDRETMMRLKLRTNPHMLRRTKEKVARDLPEKIEQVVWCDMSSMQQQTYASMLRDGAQQVQDAAQQGGGNKGKAKMLMLTTLLRLRQIACDLALLDKDSEMSGQDLSDVSAKLVRLMQLLKEAHEGGHRVLLFSQFTTMLKRIQKLIDGEGYSSIYLDGASSQRGTLVKEFQKDDGPFIFLISLKAGGYGLNLTAADTVIHFDPWWNPAVEAQATDRAHRIGQTRPTTVYKMVTRGTVEEKIVRLQDKKRGLIHSTIDEEGGVDGLSQMEIESLLDM